jgi:hypothetical protein
MIASLALKGLRSDRIHDHQRAKSAIKPSSRPVAGAAGSANRGQALPARPKIRGSS